MTKAKRLAIRARLGDIVKRDLNYTNWRLAAVKAGTSKAYKASKPTANPQSDVIIRQGYIIDKKTMEVIGKLEFE